MQRSSEVLDSSLALSRVGGDLDFLLDVVGIAQAACPTLINDVRQAIERRDLKSLKKAIRLVKTVAEDVSARRTYVGALRIETLCRYGEWDAAEQACTTLESEMNQLKPALAELEEALWFSQC
jgi:HPt (histidine-containing phosphotransfer) domain-containing protein